MNFPEEKIEKYIAGEMSGSELVDFEKLINQDSSLKKEVAFRQSVKFVFKNKEGFEFDDILKNVISESPFLPEDFNAESPAKNKLSGVSKIILGLVATGLLVFGLLFLSNYLKKQTAANNRVIAVEYFETFENIFNFGADDNSYLATGMRAYEKENYKEAAEILELVKNSPEAQFYRAISCIESNQPEKAIAIFESLNLSDNAELEIHAKWYRALAYLFSSNRNKAIEEFEALKSSEEYGIRAKNLLNQLKK